MHHTQYQQTGGSLLDHPLTPTKFRQKTQSTSVQTNGFGMDNGATTSHYSGYGTINHHHHASSGIAGAMAHCSGMSSSTTTLHQQQQHSHSHPHNLYRQQSTSSANFSPVPAPLHAHQQHQSTTTCDLIGNTNSNVIKSTTTVNSVATASTLAGSCCSVNGAVQVHQGLGAGAACQSAELPVASNRTQMQQPQTQQEQETQTSIHNTAKEVLPACQREDGPHCCLGKDTSSESSLRNRWYKCPELHKAMDGVTYIADQTRKEEESTRVSKNMMNVFNEQILLMMMMMCLVVKQFVVLVVEC